jgi:hypothetical protein
MPNASPINRIPERPTTIALAVQRARGTGDYGGAFYYWYQYVGTIVGFFVSIDPASPSMRPLRTVNYRTLLGLLNRCARLMLSNVKLSEEGTFGETTAILDRCIFESALKVRWICRNDNMDEAVLRLISTSLQAEFDLEQEIRTNIEARGNEEPIETRMLRSINRHIDLSTYTRDEIHASRRLPNILQMQEDIGDPRLEYVINQRIGSHAIHGNWSDLVRNYLQEGDEGEIYPRDHNSPTDFGQYISISTQMLRAISAYISTCCSDEEFVIEIEALLEGILREIVELAAEAWRARDEENAAVE